MDLRHELEVIYQEYGQLTPTLIVDVAKDRRHPLHNRFEWNDKVAGVKWREEQARELIRSVKITYVDDSGHEKTIRQYHAVHRDNGHVFSPLDEIVKDDVATAVLLRQMEREWRALKRKYDHLVEFHALVLGDIDAA